MNSVLQLNPLSRIDWFRTRRPWLLDNAVAGYGAVISADRDLESTHRSDQMNDVMGVIPGWIQQREGSRTLQNKLVVH